MRRRRLGRRLNRLVEGVVAVDLRLGDRLARPRDGLLEVLLGHEGELRLAGLFAPDGVLDRVLGRALSDLGDVRPREALREVRELLEVDLWI